MKDDGWWNRLDQFVMAVFAAIVLVIVLSGTWSLATLNANSTKPASEQARQYAKDAEQEIAKRCVGSDSQALAKCAAEIVNATYENQRAEHDIVAQQAMARWALVMLYLTGGGLLITGIGIYFVRENLEEMKLQRDLTKQSVEIAADADRPYMLISKISVSGTRIAPDSIGQVPIAVNFRFENYGRSPAFLKEVSVSLVISKDLDAVPDYGECTPTRFIAGVGGWYGSLEPSTIMKDGADICKFHMSEYEIYFFGMLSYAGTNNRKHRSRFAYKMIFNGGDASERQYPIGPDSYWENT